MQYVDERIVTVDGKIFTKRYLFLEKVGEGAFSQCFKVQAMGTDQVYAMKVISKEKMKVLEKQKLVEEIRVHQSLSNPNIVFLDHWFEDQFFQYIFLEFCSNKTLEEKCRKYHETDQKIIRRYGLQIVEALKYLHSKRVLHRDLKLSNFFLNHEDNIKLGDFGFACRLQNQQELKRDACGTPNYAAPEVIGGFGYSFPADVWSFGVILYRMKFGICPFETPELKQTLRKIKSADFTIPRWSSTSDQLKDLIMKTILIDYDARLTLEQIQQHPFFKKLQSVPRTGSLRNFISRLFSSDKNDKDDNKRMDSCENKKDIKKILKQKTQQTPKSSRNILVNNSLAEKTKEGPGGKISSRNKSPKSPTRDQTNKTKLGKLLMKEKPPLQSSERPTRKKSPPQSQRFLPRTEPTKKDASYIGNATARFNENTREYEITMKPREVNSFYDQTKPLNEPTKTLNEPTKPLIEHSKPKPKEIVAQNQVTTVVNPSPLLKHRNQESLPSKPTQSAEIAADQANKITPSDRLARMTNKFKHHQSNSIVQHYASFLIYDVTIINDHHIIYLTNGIRQILTPTNAYIVFQPGSVVDRDGLRIIAIPKMVEYLTKEKMVDSKFKLVEQSFKQLVEKGQYISKWKTLADRAIYSMGPGVVVITTNKPNTFYLKTPNFDYLYNSKLELITDEIELTKSKVVYDQYIMRAKNTSGSGRSTSRQRKLLE